MSAVRRCRRDAVAAALVVVAAACSQTAAPQFVVQGTGKLSGILFFDRDRSGTFDPSAGDTVLRNIHVLVYTRGTTEVLAGADTRTDSTGRFVFAGLPAGTHSLQVDTTGNSALVAFCNNPLPVSIYLDETAFVSVDGRGGCVINIKDAELKSLGTRVTVRGTVTSTLAQISTGQAYIEDATGAIQIFSPSGPPFAIGDVIEVSGTLAAFSNELELSGSTVNTVTAGPPLVAVDVTGADASAAGGDQRANLQGRLIRVKAAKLLDLFTTGGARNAQIDDGSGGVLTVRFDSHVITDATTLQTAFSVGKCYNWTGILKAFTSPPIELFPRSLSDVTEVPCP